MRNRSAATHSYPEAVIMKSLAMSFSTSRYSKATTFGEFITKARLETGLRQVDVAATMSVDENSIVHTSHGSRRLDLKAYGSMEHRIVTVGRQAMINIAPLDCPMLIKRVAELVRDVGDMKG